MTLNPDVFVQMTGIDPLASYMPHWDQEEIFQLHACAAPHLSTKTVSLQVSELRL